MRAIRAILSDYYSASFEDVRAAAVSELLQRAAEDDAMKGLLGVFNEENISLIRLAILKVVAEARPAFAVHALTKAMFDPDPAIRTRAAAAVAAYDDAELLAPSLPQLLDAIPDPATRSHAAAAILAVTGKSPDQITVTEREQIRRGEHPKTIWPAYFANLPSPRQLPPA